MDIIAERGISLLRMTANVLQAIKALKLFSRVQFRGKSTLSLELHPLYTSLSRAPQKKNTIIYILNILMVFL